MTIQFGLTKERFNAQASIGDEEFKTASREKKTVGNSLQPS